MNKVIKGCLLVLLAGGIASCNLDKYPEGSSIPGDSAFETVDDAAQFRNGIYSYVRTCLSSTVVIPVNIQAEGINATVDFGNNYGPQYTWSFLNSDDAVETIWGNCYATIYQLNYFLENCNRIRQEQYSDVATDDTEAQGELDLLDLYIGEAHLFRAMLYYTLATFYCQDYDPATAETTPGLVLTSTADVTQRLERSTLAKTFDTINYDLNVGRDALVAYYNGVSQPGSYYLTPLVADCLEAKVLLHMDDWDNAATAAAAIADSHALISDADAFQSMWTNNDYGASSEILFQFYADVNEGRSQYGSIFLNDPYNNGQQCNPLYLPTQWIISQFPTNDIRLNAYFGQRNVMVSTGTYTNLRAVTKYPGNPALNSVSSTNEFMHNVVVYRNADFVLMAAEAYARQGDQTNAETYLNKLLSTRIAGYQAPTYASVDEVFEAIKTERLKEMFMEGNRIADLKRWGDPMDRAGQDPQNSDIIVSTGAYLTIQANDYRFTWPIPQSETNSNPNITDNNW